MTALAALLQSRKFYVGTLSVLAVFVATYLRAIDKIPADALLPTILGIAGLGGTFMASTSVEDAATKIMPARPALPPAAANASVTVVTPPATPDTPTPVKDTDPA